MRITDLDDAWPGAQRFRDCSAIRPYSVMAGRVPAIHALAGHAFAVSVDARNKSGHDE